MFCGRDLWWTITFHIFHWSCWDTLCIPNDHMELSQTPCVQVPVISHHRDHVVNLDCFQFLPTVLHGLCSGFCFAGPLPLFIPILWCLRVSNKVQICGQFIGTTDPFAPKYWILAILLQFVWTTANENAPHCGTTPNTLVNQVTHNLIAFRMYVDRDDNYIKGAIDELLIVEQALPEDVAIQLYHWEGRGMNMMKKCITALFKISVKSTRQTRSLQHSALSILLQWD